MSTFNIYIKDSALRLYSFFLSNGKGRMPGVMALLLLCCAALSCGRSSKYHDMKGERVAALNNCADSLQTAGDYIHSLDTLLVAYRIIDESGEVPDSVKVRTYFLLGRSYSIYGDADAAERYYLLALGLGDKVRDKGTLLKTYCNIFATYASLNNYAKADSINEALNRLETPDTLTKKFHYLFNRAFLSSHKNDWNKAVDQFQATLEFLNTHDSLAHLRIYPYSELGHIYSVTGRSDSAYKYLRLFEMNADSSGQPYVKVSALRDMMMWAAKNDNAPMAADYLDRYFTFTDSLINLRAFLKAKENIRRYEDESSRIKIDDMSDQLTSRHRWIINLSFLLILMALLAAFAIWRNITANRNNRLLYAKNVELANIEALYREMLLSQPQPDPQPEKEGKNEESGEERKRDLELLERIIREMEENQPYLDADYSLQALAAAVGSNTKYVSQVINEELDRNFRSFINEYRIREAERRLTDSDNYGNLTIQAVAESVGIKSKSTFVAAFKKVTGLTPSVYVKMSKE